MAARHGHIGDVGAPNLIRPGDPQIAQQIGINAVRFVRDARARFAVDGLHAHLTTQALQALPVDDLPVIALQHRDQPSGAQAGIAQIQFIKQSFEPRIFRTLGHRHVVQVGARYSQQFALRSHAQPRVFWFDELGSPLHTPSCLDFLPGNPPAR